MNRMFRIFEPFWILSRGEARKTYKVDGRSADFPVRSHLRPRKVNVSGRCRGHPFAFARGMFGELEAMHGDKAVWKLLDRHADEVAEVRVPGPVPRDVDTWADYEAVREEFEAA